MEAADELDSDVEDDDDELERAGQGQQGQTYCLISIVQTLPSLLFTGFFSAIGFID